MVVEEPRRFQGTGKSGKGYDFTQRRLQIFTGNKLVECSERLPDAKQGEPLPEFSSLTPGAPVRFRVTRVSMNNGQPGFDVQTV